MLSEKSGILETLTLLMSFSCASRCYSASMKRIDFSMDSFYLKIANYFALGILSKLDLLASHLLSQHTITDSLQSIRIDS
jgi:hypothetical protein